MWKDFVCFISSPIFLIGQATWYMGYIALRYYGFEANIAFPVGLAISVGCQIIYMKTQNERKKSSDFPVQNEN